MPHLTTRLSGPQYEALKAVFQDPERYVEEVVKERADQILQDMALAEEIRQGADIPIHDLNLALALKKTANALSA